MARLADCVLLQEERQMHIASFIASLLILIAVEVGVIANTQSEEDCKEARSQSMGSTFASCTARAMSSAWNCRGATQINQTSSL
jgi:hypothetical protein